MNFKIGWKGDFYDPANIPRNSDRFVSFGNCGIIRTIEFSIGKVPLYCDKTQKPQVEGKKYFPSLL